MIELLAYVSIVLLLAGNKQTQTALQPTYVCVRQSAHLSIQLHLSAKPTYT